MACDKTKLMFGPVAVTVNDTDLGFTTADGVSFSVDETLVPFDGGQKGTNQAYGRSLTEVMATFDLAQLSQANLQLIWGTAAPSAGVLTGAFTAGIKTEAQITLTGQLQDGSPRVITGTGVIRSTGEMAMSKTEWSALPIEFTFVGDSNDVLFLISDTAASATAPTIASYDTVDTSTLAETSLADTDTGVARDEWIQIVMSQAVRLETMTGSNITLSAAGANTFLPWSAIVYGTTGGETDRTKILAKPASDLAGTTEHYLTVGTGVKNLQGIPLAAGAIIQFTTGS